MSIMDDSSTTKYTFQDFSTISSCGGPIWHPTEDILYFISTMENVFQIYQTDITPNFSLWPTRLTFTQDRTTDPKIANNGKIFYSSDQGGNENWQINKLHPDTKNSIMITDKLDRKHELAIITDKQLIFTANRSDKSRFDIYNYTFEGKKIELLYESHSKGILSCDSITEDEKELLVNERISINEKKFYLFDFKSGKLDLISITDKDSWQKGTLLDNEHVLCLTNRDKEFYSLAIINIVSNKFHYLEEDPWDTNFYVYSEKAHRIAWAKNKNGYSRLFCAFLEDYALKDIFEIQLPEKSVINAGDLRSFTQPLAFNHDASKIAICLDSSISNMNIWIASIEKSTVKDFWQATKTDTEKIYQSIFIPETLHKIKSFDNLEFDCFVHIPEIQTQKLPCIIMIHGGPEGQMKPDFNPLVQFFLYNGFAVVYPNVRGSVGYGRTFNTLDDVELRLNSVKDIAALANYLKDIPEIDSTKLIVYGGSYGGYMVLACMTEFPELFAGGIDIVGISNFVTFLENTASWRRKVREVEYGTLEKNREFLESISPINKANRITKPLLIVHGKNDERVPLKETLQMYDLLKTRSVPVELLIFDDEGHGVVKTENKKILYKKIIDFLRKNFN